MLVLYRMCGIASTNPSPIFQEDKFKLNQLCLRSFVHAFKDIKPEMIFLNDYCDERYVEMERRICPFRQHFINTNIGINETMLTAYNLASQQDDDILFQECDYLYLPETGKEMQEAIKCFGLVSPYDHPDFYMRFDIHPQECEIQLLNNHHYRSSRRNTMTFGITKERLQDGLPILNKYGYLDSDVWIELSARGHKLKTPIPSFATHMAKDYLAPGVDWKSLWENLA